MVTHPIQWHQQCQKNVKKYIDDQEKSFERIVADIRREREMYNFREMQIQEAIKMGVDTFDHQKFLVKKNRGKK